MEYKALDWENSLKEIKSHWNKKVLKTLEFEDYFLFVKETQKEYLKRIYQIEEKLYFTGMAIGGSFSTLYSCRKELLSNLNVIQKVIQIVKFYPYQSHLENTKAPVALRKSVRGAEKQGKHCMVSSWGN